MAKKITVTKKEITKGVLYTMGMTCLLILWMASIVFLKPSTDTYIIILTIFIFALLRPR